MIQFAQKSYFNTNRGETLSNKIVFPIKMEIRSPKIFHTKREEKIRVESLRSEKRVQRIARLGREEKSFSKIVWGRKTIVCEGILMDIMHRYIFPYSYFSTCASFPSSFSYSYFILMFLARAEKRKAPLAIRFTASVPTKWTYKKIFLDKILYSGKRTFFRPTKQITFGCKMNIKTKQQKKGKTYINTNEES